MAKPIEACHQALGVRIRLVREALGVTQDELAKRAGYMDAGTFSGLWTPL